MFETVHGTKYDIRYRLGSVLDKGQFRQVILEPKIA